MSLLDDMMEPFVMLNSQSDADGYGGDEREWTEGDKFDACAVLNRTVETRTGAVQGQKSGYTITTGKSVVLKPFDVFKRVSDGKIFRATSDGGDKATPKVATLDMRQVFAEEYRTE